MESVSEYRCRQCGNILPGERLPGDLCQECRSSSLTEAVPSPEMATQTLAASSSSELPGRIGPYKVLGLLGEGGMGAVYLVEQEKPIRRKLALKVIKLGMDSTAVIARFESERQALAMMNHPNIAQVHDAGTTDRGAPYFAMEYVPGLPIGNYCDKHRLSTRERLELFIPVCRAIQHAHQRGIIHRDIKPSNVLVGLQDGKPVPKIIDFGVAKATSQRLTEKTVFTQQGYLIGTPEYMSPEQAELTGLDIDTTTDIYSLGVLLYELLVGALPFDPRELRRAGFDEIRRIIREVEAPKPTTRLSSLGHLAKEIAERRHTDVASLAKELGGDLDWIALKAMEKDRTRRYASSSELAADIERHLRNEPVVACPPSSLYRMRKFVRRHRLGVGIAATAVLVLIAFAVTTLVQSRHVARERDRAERVSAFLVSLFEASDPDRSKGEKVTVRELIDKGVVRLGVELKDEPVTRTRLLHTIGRVYYQLGLYDAAERALDQALPFRRTLSGSERLDLAATLNELGRVYSRKGDYGRTEAAYREVLAIRRAVLGPDHPDVGKILHNLGTLAEARGHFDEAVALYKQALPLLKRLDDPAETALTLLTLGGVYSKQDKLDAALENEREALELLRRSAGVEHSWTLTAMNNLGWSLYTAGKYDEAEKLQRELLATRHRIFGNEHFDVAISLYNLGNTLDELGRFAEAEDVLKESANIWRKTLPQPHVQVAWALNDLGSALQDDGQYDKADQAYREALAIFQKASSARKVDTAWAWQGLGDVSFSRGRKGEAEKYYRTALGLRQAAPDAAATLVAASEAALGRLLCESGTPEEGTRMVRDALDIRQRVLPQSHWRIGYTQALLGRCLAEQRSFTDAEPLLLKGYDLLRAKRGDGREETRQTTASLVALYKAWGKPDRAALYETQARVEKPRLLFALCSRFIRLNGFFMEFRGRNAHPNRPLNAK